MGSASMAALSVRVKTPYPFSRRIQRQDHRIPEGGRYLYICIAVGRRWRNDRTRRRDTVDKTALTDRIAEAEAMTQGDKTDAAWQALQDAIAAAKEAAETADSQEEADQALAALNQAVETFQNSEAEGRRT